MGKTTRILPHVGIIGAGTIGGAIAARLMEARYMVSIYDTNRTRTESMRELKALTPDTITELVKESQFILLCLPSTKAFLEVQKQLLPALTHSRTVIDFGATDVAQTRKFAQLLDDKGINFLDAPVSGSKSKAKEGGLSIFVGGKKELFTRCLPLFKVLSVSGKATYCGPAGAGQIVKAVDQLATSLANAAFLEAIGYGMAFGATPAGLLEAMEKSNASRVNFESIAKKLVNEGGENISLSFSDLPNYTAAESGAASLPLTNALIGYLKGAPPTVIEGGMHVPCFWTELTRKQKKK
jgi:2-hydroxy-3-oxopropionate reductase